MTCDRPATGHRIEPERGRVGAPYETPGRWAGQSREEERVIPMAKNDKSAKTDISESTIPGSVEPRRLRWSVPLADASTNQWLDLQNNISQSLQQLIREAIARDGYVDVVNKPVEQLPRRGRPPQDEGGIDVDTEPQAQPLESAVADDVLSRDAVSEIPTETPARVEQTFAEPESEPDSEAPASASGQVDMNSLFGHNK